MAQVGSGVLRGKKQQEQEVTHVNSACCVVFEKQGRTTCHKASKLAKSVARNDHAKLVALQNITWLLYQLYVA